MSKHQKRVMTLINESWWHKSKKLVLTYDTQQKCILLCSILIKLVMTQFEIECRCGGHSVTKKFKTILQILLAEPKLWKNLYFYK